jgi:hypothetical protein
MFYTFTCLLCDLSEGSEALTSWQQMASIPLLYYAVHKEMAAADSRLRLSAIIPRLYGDL